MTRTKSKRAALEATADPRTAARIARIAEIEAEMRRLSDAFRRLDIERMRLGMAICDAESQRLSIKADLMREDAQ